MSVIAKVSTCDFRFPTSATFSGSDAMNPDPDYSSAYVVVSTDAGDSGNGFVFTIGRGNDVVVRAIDSMSETLIGRNVEELLDNMRIAHLKEVGYPGYSTAAGWRAVGKIQRSMCKIRRSI